MRTPRERLLEIIRLGALLLLAIALQAVFTSRFTVLGVTADVFLIFPVLVGMSRGSLVGAVFGFVSGLLADVIFMDPIGLRTLIYLLVGYLSGRYAEWMPPYSAWVVVALTAVATLLGQSTYAIFQFITGNKAPFLSMIWRQVLPAAAVNGLLVAPLYLGLARLKLVSRLEPGPRRERMG
jgi:rod shape-determining protein MreD